MQTVTNAFQKVLPQISLVKFTVTACYTYLIRKTITFTETSQLIRRVKDYCWSVFSV